MVKVRLKSLLGGADFGRSGEVLTHSLDLLEDRLRGRYLDFFKGDHVAPFSHGRFLGFSG